LQDYVRKYAPAVLRYDKRTDTHGHYAVNFGNSKGRTFDRVLILPHGRIKEYLRTGKAKAIDGSREKFYVAVTRAKFSVAFLFDEVAQAGYRLWEP
jgi:DNA helicase-2/ATP-dependent DNA helicase PcrA